MTAYLGMEHVGVSHAQPPTNTPTNALFERPTSFSKSCDGCVFCLIGKHTE